MEVCPICFICNWYFRAQIQSKIM